MDSILTSVKKLLGIAEECEDFDADIVMYLNSVFMVLTQMGVGPKRYLAGIISWSEASLCRMHTVAATTRPAGSRSVWCKSSI